MVDRVEVITVGGTGSLTSMHSDTGVLNKLGSMSIQRATEILYHEKSGKWYIDPMLGDSAVEELPEALTGFNGYNNARAFEVAWVKTCHATSCDIKTDKQVCQYVRNYYDWHLAPASGKALDYIYSLGKKLPHEVLNAILLEMFEKIDR